MSKKVPCKGCTTPANCKASKKCLYEAGAKK